jgi:two-component system, OmpR family, phosphate regulon sensor histidine kinase PhoR
LVDLHIPEAEQRGTSLVYLPSPVPLWVDADVGRIRQVITNLLVNALNYTPSGGLIRVKVVGQGGEVRVSVRDTGVGIPPDLKERIFEPFFRVGDSAVRGTGLGLSIAREIVEMLGGTITVESTVGSGSEFTVTLKTTS